MPHCLQRLRPRDCVRGAFSDVYALKWNTNVNEKFFCIDVNGLYSYCAINFPYMTGKFETLIGPTLKELTIENNKFRYQNVSIMGSILLKILPPPDLYAPFLLYKLKNGSVVNTLCKTCAESKIKICNHSEEQRSFIATYMISEIEFALTLNYKILQIYEAHVFVDSQFILRDFIQKLNYFKTLNSNCLKNLQSTEEKEK